MMPRTEGPCPTVHVVDDEASLRSALAFLLSSHDLPVCTYASGPAFLAACDEAPLRGVILLDVRMEPMSGLQVHDELLRRGATLPVLFLSGHGDIPMAVEAVHKGALDFIEKPFSGDQLVQRIRQALTLEDEQHRSRAHTHQEHTRLASLTDRETEVMVRVAKGMLNKVIADELCVSVRTVEVHRSRVFAKLGVRSAAELATVLVHAKWPGP